MNLDEYFGYHNLSLVFDMVDIQQFKQYLNTFHNLMENTLYAWEKIVAYCFLLLHFHSALFFFLEKKNYWILNYHFIRTKKNSFISL